MIKNYFLIFLLFGFFLSLNSCSQFETKTQDKSPLYKYKADIAITVNDQTFDGMAVIDLKNTQTIKIVSKAKLDVLIISNGHRNRVHEKLDKNWYGGVGKEYKYEYIPNKTELDEKLPLYIQAFSEKGITAWGYIAFRTNEKMRATVDCNGDTLQTVGFTLCQSMSGFSQTIRFNQTIPYTEGDASCNLEVIDKDTRTTFKITPDEFCNLSFSNGTELHQATFLGYKEVLIRGE